MRFLLWLTGLLLVAVAGVWPGFAHVLAQLVGIAGLLLLTGLVHLLAQPPILAVAAAAAGMIRLARRGWHGPARTEAGR